MRDAKPTFFTSDWHLGHAECLVFDQRPFTDVDHMHRVLINNYNSIVPPHGICYFLGDIGVSSSETAQKVLAQLNGTKVLILGNHDKKSNAMYKCGFDVVLNSASIWLGDYEVTLTHCPLRGLFREDITGMKNAKAGDLWHGESKQIKFSIENHGQFHLHGHIHSGPANKKSKSIGRQMDVGVCANKYRPVSLSEIESWIHRVTSLESSVKT
jgi:calcineurin-like phosphoesterase family protein